MKVKVRYRFGGSMDHLTIGELREMQDACNEVGALDLPKQSQLDVPNTWYVELDAADVWDLCEAATELRDRLSSTFETPELDKPDLVDDVPEGCVLIDEAVYVRMKQDIRDMMSSPQTAFVRCACGRVRSRGIICPTNAEGGHCAAGE